MKFVKVKMLLTQRGSPDGVHVHVYEQGQTYDLPESLAAVFLRQQWAEAVVDVPPQPEPAAAPVEADAVVQERQTAKGRARR